jgi:Telomere resolvase
MQNITRAHTLVSLEAKSPSSLERMNTRELTLALERMGVAFPANAKKRDLLRLVKLEMGKPRDTEAETQTLIALDTVEVNLLESGQLWNGSNESVALIYFEELRRLTIEQWDTLNRTWLPPQPELYATAARLSVEIGGLRHTKTGESLAPTSKLSIARDVLALIKRSIATTADQYYHQQLLANYETHFRRVAFQGLGGLMEAKATQEKESLNARRVTVTVVNLTLSLHWARTILEQLDTFEITRRGDRVIAPQWGQVSCALALVTGRRQGEIHSTARFVPTGANSVLFTGQLKEKGKVGGQSEEGYEIPTLVDSALVVAGLEWLRDAHKRKPTPKESHNAYSKYLSADVKVWFDRCLPDVEPGHYHNFRQFYALCATRAFCPVEMTERYYKGTILGHSTDEKDDATTGRYEADYKLSADSDVTA